MKDKKPILMTRTERNNLVMQIVQQYDNLKTGIPLPPYVITGTRIFIDEAIDFNYDHPMPQIDRILQIRLYNNKRQKSFFNLKYTGNQPDQSNRLEQSNQSNSNQTQTANINNTMLNEEMQKMIQNMINDAKRTRKDPNEPIIISTSGQMTLSANQSKVINEIKETKVVNEIPAEILNNPNSNTFNFELPPDNNNKN